VGQGEGVGAKDSRRRFERHELRGGRFRHAFGVRHQRQRALEPAASPGWARARDAQEEAERGLKPPSYFLLFFF